MNDQKLFDYLKTIGVCKLCCLRYLNVKNQEYLNVDEALVLRKLQPTDEIQQPKKKKDNICVACLDIFEPVRMKGLIDTISSSDELKKYQCTSMLSSISLPISLNLRQLSIWMDLINKFDFIDKERAPDVPLKEVIKLMVNPQVCALTNREWDRDQTGIMTNIFFTYENDNAEMELLEKVNPDLFKQRSGRKSRKEFMTRNAFEKAFQPKMVDFEVFSKYIKTEIPSQSIILEKITFTGPTVFLAGRYCKLSRELSQTPWILNGKRKMESSVQEIMTEVIAPHFKVPADTMLFSSSGREDVDVRCLGKGRPFVLEIPNSYETVLSDAARMEDLITKSGKISVSDLQMVKREELVHIKHGEENKKKIYRALCYLKQPVTVETLKKLDLPDGFTMQQVTPLRVLHRRPLIVRPRRIHSVKAWATEKNKKCIILDLTTQAGSYIKELVTGEFGRTEPSITSIIGEFIDIIALDVMAIDLDWPPVVDNSLLNKQTNC